MTAPSSVDRSVAQEAVEQVIRRTLVIPFWEQTAMLHGMMAVLRDVCDGRCAFADNADQIQRMRQYVERLLQRDPLVRLHDALVEPERRLQHGRTHTNVSAE